MTPRAANSRHALESCTLQLHAWKPFQIQTLGVDPPKPYPLQSKKPCRSDRSTAPDLDFSRLSLLDDPPPPSQKPDCGLRWFDLKRRRRGSRSVSGRSTDRSGTRRRAAGGGASAACATCSDFPLAAGGTDSSGELFVNGDGSWGSDVSEVVRMSKREGKEVAGLERDREGFGANQVSGGLLDGQGNESGYGSEPGYRGDGELGYGDEFDEEEEDGNSGRVLFWGGRSGQGM